MPSPGNQYQGRPQRQPQLRHHSRPRPEINTAQDERFTPEDSSQVPRLPTTLSRHFQLSLPPGQQQSMRAAVSQGDARPSTRPDRPGSALNCWQHSDAVAPGQPALGTPRSAPISSHTGHRLRICGAEDRLCPPASRLSGKPPAVPGGSTRCPPPARMPASALLFSRRACRGRRWEKVSLARLGASKQSPTRRSDLPAIRLSSISHAREPLR